MGHWARACTCTCRWLASLRVRTRASPNTRLLRDSVHNAEELSVQPDSLSLSLSQQPDSLSLQPDSLLSSQPPSPPCNSVTLSTVPENNSLSRDSPCELSQASHLVRPRKLSLDPLCPPFSNRGPVFNPAPLRAPSRTSSKGACHLAFPSPRPVRGTRELVLAQSQGNHFPGRKRKGREKPAYHCRFFMPRLHPSRGDRDHTVPARWRVVYRWCMGGGVVACMV